jgi:Collagen triple helix repeat (20 copies)
MYHHLRRACYRALVPVAAVLMLAVVPSIASASGGTITLCINKHGVIKGIDVSCKPPLYNLTWDSNGVYGPTGPVGPQGPEGPPGYKGVTGATGTQGIPGPAGPVGYTGATGDLGPKGPTGATGPQGPQGAPGATGDSGATGPQGIPGPAGDVGNAGADGNLGPKGPTGATGPEGVQGAQGDTGDTGPAGYPGDDGYDGKNGVQVEVLTGGTRGPDGSGHTAVNPSSPPLSFSVGDPVFMGPGNGSDMFQASVSVPMAARSPFPATLSHLLVAVDKSPNAKPGDILSYMFEVCVNANCDTGLTCTISSSQTECSDTWDSVTYNDTDTISLKAVPDPTTVSPANIYNYDADASYSLELTRTLTALDEVF